MKTSPETTYADLKQSLLALGFARPGSLVRRFMPCGKPSCRCSGGPSRWHGPYYQWSWKVRGKTVTRRLTEAQARNCAEWVANHRALRGIVRRMESLSLKETDRLLAEISSP